MSLFIVTAFADTSIKAEMDKVKISTDESLTYKLIITSTEKNIPAVQLPDFKGFSVLSQARSSTVSFAERNLKTILVYAYILAPEEQGKFKIGPSTIKVRGKVYSTQGFEIEVIQGEAKAKPQPEQKPPLPKKLKPQSQEPQVTL